MASTPKYLILSLMLFYHGHGERDYRQQPHPLRQRAHWEFAAILHGSATPTTPAGPLAYPSEQQILWVFPPRHLHGWSSTEACRICTLHLAHCPRIIADNAETRGHLMVPLSDSDTSAIAHMQQTLLAINQSESGSGEIMAQLCAGTLGAIILPHVGHQTIVREQQQQHEHTIKQVLAWLDARLHDNPSIEQAIVRVGVSAAHFRRICHAISGKSPRDLHNDLRLQRAQDLLRQTNDNLDTIAWSCGYSSAVALSNAFKRRFAVRPGEWRRTQA